MELEPPIKKHLLGKLPTHSSTKNLASNFKGYSDEFMVKVLESGGYLEKGRFTMKARNSGLVDSCESKALWNLSLLQELLRSEGLKADRAYVNQELPVNPSVDPVYTGLAQIGVHFEVSGPTVGKWMDKLGLREENSLPKEKYVKDGLAVIAEMTMPGKKKQTKKFAKWDLYRVVPMLVEAGHPLDFNYEKSLKGKGKNSDVKVTGIDLRVKEFCKEFVSLYNAKDRQALKLVDKTPKLILNRAEDKLKKPGFFSEDRYKRRFEK